MSFLRELEFQENVMLIDDIRPSMPGRTKWRFHTELDYTYKHDVTEWAHNDTGFGVYLK